MRRIYLDNAASTPVSGSVFKAMVSYLSKEFGNPGSLHDFGQIAMKAVDESRSAVAKALNAGFREIIFTGSATEANNLVLRGVVKAWKRANPNKPPRVIVSSIEHESILETARDLKKEGCEVEEVPVSKSGVINLKVLEKLLNEDTALVSVMYGNNEIGTIQPIREIAELIRRWKEERVKNKGLKVNSEEKSAPSLILNSKFLIHPLLHTDAVQAFQYCDADVANLGVDFMTLSAHKIFGPKGIGVLYVRNQTKNLKDLRFAEGSIAPLITGGNQEFGLRSGTENVPHIVGAAKAITEAVVCKKKRIIAVEKIRKTFISSLEKIDGVQIFGSENTKGSLLPHIVSVAFKKDAQDLLIALDLRGIAVSTGSACSMRSTRKSHVLQALGFNDDAAGNVLRFSFSAETKASEINTAVKVLKGIIQKDKM